MEKEMRVLGYQPSRFRFGDAGGFLKALQNCAQPDALILCPLSGNLQQDAACIQAVAQVCQRELEPNEGAMKHLVKRQKLSQEQAQQLALLPQGARVFPCHQSALPGFEAAGEGFHIVVMPSDPEEQISLFFSYLFQILKKASASPLRGACGAGDGDGRCPGGAGAGGASGRPEPLRSGLPQKVGGHRAHLRQQRRPQQGGHSAAPPLCRR